MKRPLFCALVAVLLPAAALWGQEELPAKGKAAKGAPAKVAPAKGAPAKAATPAIESIQEQASYALGVNIGRQLLNEDAGVDSELLIQGLRDALAKKKLALSDADMEKAMAEFSKEVQARAVEKAKAASETFLADNKKKKGVTTTKTGLQYKVLKSGEGKSPKKTDTVRVHYHGTLTDGTVFDSSVERMEPTEFPVDRVIPGWTEALLAMKVGDKWQIVIPPELGYGERGTPGGPIPPNSVLVFDVELLEIVE
jgi:FKBP-type peptidyl-prolyl cis-trans isomerase